MCEPVIYAGRRAGLSFAQKCEECVDTKKAANAVALAVKLGKDGTRTVDGMAKSRLADRRQRADTSFRRFL